MRTQVKMVVLVLLAAGNALAADTPAARPGFETKSEVANGLQTITFTTPAGAIIINLPDDLRTGDTITGTITITAQRKSAEAQAANEPILASHTVELDQQPRRELSPTMTWTLPAALPSGSVTLIMRDEQGGEVARTQLAVTAKVERAAQAFHLPEIGQQGRLLEVVGPFDGDLTSTHLLIEDEKLRLLAESPRKLIVRNSSTKIGMALLALRERDRTAETDFRSVTVNLTAPKTALVKGETTTLTVKVAGLHGLTQAISLVLENSSTGVISLSGGDSERFRIEPSAVVDGSSTIERSVTGIKRGSWSITCSVVKDE